ncbi:MAG: YceI family protein [Myxococcales bacterium]|nr:YceI family protein [Myxococcales bacterium]
MPTYDASRAECLVFTYKEGLLSKIAHDLEIRVERFEVKVEGTTIEATFDPTSLRVVTARKDGQPNAGALSAGDRAKIEGNITGEVLETKRHPEVRFTGRAEVSDQDARVHGELTLHGRTRPLDATVRREGARWVTRVRLHQPDFGIKPYSAMLGTLKIQPDVEIELRVPAES